LVEGVRAMQAGDVLVVRGAHGAFNGRYREPLTLAPVSQLSGRGVACSASAPCVIRGCTAPTCPTTERPIITAWFNRTDWRASTAGVWWRTMEATPYVADQRDSWDPGGLYDATGRPLGYDGDNVTNVRAGHWSYHPSTHRIYVGSAAPNTIRVPHYTYGALLRAPTTYMTLENLRIESPRLTGIEIGQPVNATRNLRLINVEVSGFLRFGVHGHTLPDVRMERNTIEYGCRGASFVRNGWGGCFGIRLFAADRGALVNNTVRHMGFITRCSWCDAPWNNSDQTRLESTGNGLQVKQTGDGVISGNNLSDLSTQAVMADVSRRISITDNVIQRVRMGISSGNKTPQPSCCPSTSPSCYCTSSDNVIERNTLISVGGSSVPGGCVLYVEDGRRHTDSTFLARVRYDNIIAPRGPAICVPSPPPPGLVVSNNTITAGGSLPGDTTTTTFPMGETTTTTFPTGDTTTTTFSDTIPSSTTTTTTLPPSTDEHCLAGRKLVIAARADSPTGSFRMRSTDTGNLLLGDDATAQEMRAMGGSIRVQAMGGDRFDETFPLPATSWHLMDEDQASRGLRFRNPEGAISRIAFKAGRGLAVSGKAVEGLTLGSQPNAVRVTLQIGTTSYRLEFRNMDRFVVDKSLVSKDEPAPERCD
jgi:hypothetical protein